MAATSLGKSGKVWPPQMSVPVPRATTMTELAVSRRGRVRAPAGRPWSRQPRVARAGPPVSGLRYSRLVRVCAPGGPGHQPPQGRVGLVPRVAADRAVLSVARAGREQRGGAGGGSRGVPDGQRVAGVGVVADEAGPQAQHERDVEAVHPHRGLVAAGMDVAVPAPPG